MGEITTNYEEKYKQALEWMRELYPTLQGMVKEDAEHCFPELLESEDERIRKEIIQSIKDNMCVIHKDKCLAWLEKQGEQKSVIVPKFMVGDKIKLSCEPKYPAREIVEIKDNAYYFDSLFHLPIEKQNEWELVEQKPAKWSEEDEHRVKDTIYFLENAKKHYASTVELDACIDWLKSLKPQPKQKRSEEDEYQINTILHGLDLKRELYRKEGNQVEEKRYKTQYDWLKSLKPQPRWKPTENQMSKLLAVINDGNNANSESCHIGLLSLYNDLKSL